MTKTAYRRAIDGAWVPLHRLGYCRQCRFLENTGERDYGVCRKRKPAVTVPMEGHCRKFEPI